MPKAGRYDFPSRDLDTCLSFLRTAHDKHKTFQMSRGGFAEAIGHSPKTGPFGVLIGSMAQFGLVDTGDGNVTYTALTKHILFGTPQEQISGREQAVRNITLFADIFARYGRNLTDDQLKLFLRESAGVDIAEAAEKANEVGKIFKKVVTHLTDTSAAGEQQSPMGLGENKKMNENQDDGLNIQPDVEHYKLGGGIQITLPKEIDKALAAWERVKSAMDMILGVQPQKGRKESTS